MPAPCDLVGSGGPPLFRRIGLLGSAVLFLAGCGAAPAATPHAASTPVARPGAPHPLVPRPLSGQALSVLQMGAASWLAVKTPHGIVVTMVEGQHGTQSTVPSAGACSGSGALRAVGSTPMVMGARMCGFVTIIDGCRRHCRPS